MPVQSSSQVASAGSTTELRNTMRSNYQSLLSQYFGSTLNQVPDIVNILVAQAYFESHLNTYAIGTTISLSSSIAKDYLSSSAISSYLQGADPLGQSNVQVGLSALGVGQSLGLNAVRGASAKTGKCLIEAARPDLASQLCVNPGDDLIAVYLGESNLNNAQLAQLVVLESKYKNVIPSGAGFMSKGDPLNRIFPSKIAAAVAAYLGLGISDSNGTTPGAYAASIVGGSTYAIANGVSLEVAQRNTQRASNSGPSTNGSGQGRISPAGC